MLEPVYLNEEETFLSNVLLTDTALLYKELVINSIHQVNVHSTEGEGLNRDLIKDSNFVLLTT